MYSRIIKKKTIDNLVYMSTAVFELSVDKYRHWIIY